MSVDACTHGIAIGERCDSCAAKPKCGTCRFFVGDDVPVMPGSCVRYAPHPHFPVVDPRLDWCGDHEAKP